MDYKKDTADGDDGLNHGGGDAEWVEDLLVPSQHTLPGQGGEQDGVEADAYEAGGSSEVVKH